MIRRKVIGSDLGVNPFRHLGIFLLLIAGILFLFNLNTINLLVFKNEKDFKSTSGIIVEADLDEKLVYGSVYYQCKVLYKYFVNQKVYHSYIIKKDNSGYKQFKNKDDAESFLNKFSKGTKVNVYYDMENPEFAYIENSSNISLGKLKIMIILFLSGIISILISIKLDYGK